MAILRASVMEVNKFSSFSIEVLRSIALATVMVSPATITSVIAFDCTIASLIWIRRSISETALSKPD